MARSSFSTKKSSESQNHTERASSEPSRQLGPNSPFANIMMLQRRAGNGAVSRLMELHTGVQGVVQPKLAVSQPRDAYEQEADRVAETVLRMPQQENVAQFTISGQARTPPVQQLYSPCKDEQPVQRLCSNCRDYLRKRRMNRTNEEVLQTKRDTDEMVELDSGIPKEIEALHGNGQPLPDSVRSFFEPRFGRDFTQVRIHTGPRSASLAQSLNARAFTVRQNIVFAPGEYTPHTPSGQKLLAHELTHVVQQSSVGTHAGAQHLENSKDCNEYEAGTVAAEITPVVSPLVIRPSVSLISSAPHAIMRAPNECLDKCEKQFNHCLTRITFSPQCMAERSICQRGCVPAQKAEAPAMAPLPPMNLSTVAVDAFEPGIVSAKDVKNDSKWVENDITGDQLSDKAPWTYTLTYKDGSKLVIPLEQVFMERLAAATVTVFRKHKASSRIVPCVLVQSDPRLKALKGQAVEDYRVIAEFATPRFDPTTAPKIVSLVNAAQMLFLGKGMLEVLQVQAMNPLMGGGMTASGRAGGGAVGRVGVGATAKGLSGAAAKEGLTFVEIGAGDLKAAIELAKKGGVKVVAVDPAAPAAAAVKELEGLGGQFVKGVAADVAPGTADHVFQYFPWRIGESGSMITGGTWRLVEDTVRLLKPNGAAHFVTEHFATAEFLAKEASQRGLKSVITETTAGAAAPGASGAGVPAFTKTLKVWMVNIYK